MTARVDRVLITEQPNVVEDRAIACDQQRQSLRTLRGLLVGAIEVVLERDVFGEEIVCGHIHGG
jgi:hypothetical protein